MRGAQWWYSIARRARLSECDHATCCKLVICSINLFCAARTAIATHQKHWWSTLTPLQTTFTECLLVQAWTPIKVGVYVYSLAATYADASFSICQSATCRKWLMPSELVLQAQGNCSWLLDVPPNQRLQPTSQMSPLGCICTGASTVDSWCHQTVTSWTPSLLVCQPI